MKLGKLAIGAVVAAVIMYFADWLWYTKCMVDYYTPMPNARPEPLMMWLILGVLVYSVAFVYIYTKGAGGGTPIGEGTRFGLWATFLAWIPMGFAWYALTNLAPMEEYLVDMAYRLVLSVGMGIVVAYVTGIPGQRTTAPTGGVN